MVNKMIAQYAGYVNPDDFSQDVANALQNTDDHTGSTPVDTAMGSLLATPGSAARAAVEHVAGGRHTIALYDEFSRYADGSLNGESPITGPDYVTTGAVAPTIVDGKAGSTGTGYIFATFDEPVHYLEATQVFNDTGLSAPMTLSWASASANTNTLIHVNYGSAGGLLTVRENGGSFSTLLSFDWLWPCNVDGETPYRVAFFVNGETWTIIGPNGEMFAGTDARIRRLHGNSVYWQPNGSGTRSVELLSVRAVRFAESDDDTPQLMPSLLEAGLLAYGRGAQGQLAGNRETWYEVTAGRTDVTGFAAMTGINFGPATIRTRLAADVTVGATSIITETHIPNGATVTINEGMADAETVTTNANPSPLPGAGTPATSSIASATTKAHSKGDAVTATSYTRGVLAYSPFYTNRFRLNEGTNIPTGKSYSVADDTASLGASTLRLGSDVVIRRQAANLLQLDSGDSLSIASGVLRLTPIALPATCTVGDLCIDSADNKVKVCSATNTWTIVGTQS